MKYIFLILSFLSHFAYLTAQKPESIGNILGVSSEIINEQYITRVTIKCENAWVDIFPYSQTTIRVRADKQVLSPNFSYAVVQTQGRDAYFSQMKESPEKWTLRTDSLIVELQKSPFRVRFLNRKNQMLNEDEPSFGINWIGEEVTAYKKLQPNEKFIGLGEKTGGLNRRGNAYENWNTDDYAYEAGADPLYTSTPFYMGLHDSLLYGIFFDNSFKTTFNFGASNDRFSSFSAVAGEMNYYFFGGSSVSQILQDYTRLTGKMDMPPLWSLGFQQCRWSYYPDKEVKTLAQTFRDKKIGGDVIYLDINYMDAYKVFTFHPTDFPQPKQLVEELKKLGFHVVVIADPGIKVEKNYFAYEQGKKEGLFLQYPDATLYTGQVWPGWCHFPDFTKAASREKWAEWLKNYTDVGIEGVWNDMNEPATWGQSFPNLVQFDFDGKGATHKQAHNVYGFQMARSSYEGLKKQLKGKRAFCLTRAAYSGIQRYSAVWTGDNVASDEHLLAGVRLLNSMGLTGMANVGCDVGGFSGNADANLYVRWMSVGCYTPFFRAHSEWNSAEHEPWSWNVDTENEARNIIAQRYRLLPYLYSLFYEAHTFGLPIMRSLAMYAPFDEKIYYNTFENQFLLGKNLLIAPVESKEKYQKVYFPFANETWYRLGSEEMYAGETEAIVDAQVYNLPVFVKSGSILPLQKPPLSTMFLASDTLQLHFYKGNHDNSFIYYEDDGETYSYENGEFYRREMLFSAKDNTLILKAVQGGFVSKYKYFKFVFHGFEKTLNMILPPSASIIATGKTPEVVVRNGNGEIRLSWEE